MHISSRIYVSISSILIFASFGLFTLTIRTDCLSRTEKVNAEVLVVEGWFSLESIDSVVKEIGNNNYRYIAITSPKLPDYFELNRNGYLIFYTKNEYTDSTEFKTNKFLIDCYSSSSTKCKSHLSFYINNEMVSEFYVGRIKSKYIVLWQGRLRDVDSILVQFDNDDAGIWGDKNLYVKSIKVNKAKPLDYKHNSIYDISTLGGNDRIKNNYEFYSQIAKQRLSSLGINGNSIIILPGFNESMNRTLNSAITLKKWIDTLDKNINGINILSSGNHSLRTQIVYKEILGDRYNIGIISVNSNPTFISKKTKLISTFREIVGIVYYKVILFWR